MVMRLMVLAPVLGVIGCGAPQTPRTGAIAPLEDSAPPHLEDTGGPELPDDPDVSGHEIVLGVGIGPARIGDAYWTFVESYGPPDSLTAYKRVFFATWMSLGLELVLASSDDAAPSDDAEVVAVGTKAFDGFAGPVVPGMERDEVIAELGSSPDPVGSTEFYPAGGSVVYGGDGSVMQVTVFPAYRIRLEPPEMVAAGGTR